MRPARNGLLVRAGLIFVICLSGLALSAGAAGAVTLNGDWAPFNRCPVEAPSMLAADGVTTVAKCFAADSPSGSVSIGSTTVPSGDTNLQLGVLQTNLVSGATYNIVEPSGGALVAAPANVPGGLLGLMCPSSIPAISQICQTLVVGSPLNTVTAVVQEAGTPSNLNPLAQLAVGQPIITLPVKIQLQNPILGSTCYIGSDTDPVVLNPVNLTAPTFTSARFTLNGTPSPTGGLASITLSSTQGDNTFSVPAANGCGGLLSLLITPIVNAKLGLPSPSGNNHLVLDNASSALAGFVRPASLKLKEGVALAKAWNSAVRP